MCNRFEIKCDPFRKYRKMLKVWQPPKNTFKIWQKIYNEEIEMKKQYDVKMEEKYKKKFAQPMMMSTYLEKFVYPYLIPAFEYCCLLALKKDVIENVKQVFNGIDAISEFLWNTNPKYPNRKKNWKSAYSLYKHRLFTKSRPYYPLHWIISKNEAALMIQRMWRGYRVRKLPEVVELREFWAKIREDNWKFKIFIPEPELVCPPRLPRNERLF